MDKTPLLLTLVLLSTVAFSSSSIEDGALRYNGYDELVANITPVEYKNSTYHWVDYSGTFLYRGSVILDENGQGVKDDKTILMFSIAKVIHNNYQRENAQYLTYLSKYFGSMSGNLVSDLANDSLEIAELSSISSGYLEGSIDSFSPDDTERYMHYETILLKKMQTTYKNSLDIESDGKFLKNYRDSLGDILISMIDNREYLIKSGELMSKNIKSRVSIKESESTTNILLIASAFVVLVFAVLIKRIKR